MGVRDLGLFDPTVTDAEKFVKLVKSDLNDIKHSFFTIGFRLHEANEYKYYRELGYENIIECAEDLFGFKKTTTYDLIEIYKSFHDPQAKMCIADKYDKYSQSQLKILTQAIWARDDFIRYAQPEETVETFKKAKSLWNKLYNRGSSPHNRGNFNTLTEFLELHADMLPASAPKALDLAKEEETKNSVYAENFIETTAVDAEPQGEDPGEQSENFSGYPENLGEFLRKELQAYIERMDYKTNFESDDKKCGVRVLPDHLSMSLLGGIGRAIEKDRTKVKHIIQKYLFDSINGYQYKIELNGRVQNTEVFCGVLTNIILRLLIKELKGE